MYRKINKKALFVMVFVLVFTCLGSVTSLAFDNGYRYASEYTGVVNGYIDSASQIDWYQFTVTENEVPAAYSIILKIPDECVYNFDLRYRESDSTERPVVVSNETIVTGSRRRTMHGVITQAGTYFVRVYSQNGTSATLESYRLDISYDKDTTYKFSYDLDNPPNADAADWSICADILGNYTFNNVIKYSSTNRIYKNAYAFIMSNYESDDESEYTNNDKATPEQTVIAANYIFSGDLMSNSKFKVETNKIYEIEELMHYLWGLDKPIVFYLDCTTLPYPVFTKYIILEDVNIGDNTITYFYPTSGNSITVDYDEFLMDGISYMGQSLTYSGTNILEANPLRPVQAVYN